MARVKLYLWPAKPPHEYIFVRPDGSANRIEGLRLRAFVRFLGKVDLRRKEGREAAFPDCIVDTGALLTVIPERIWRYLLPGVVTPLPFHPAFPAHLRRLTIAGGTFPFELGEVTIPLVDREGGSLDVTVVAKLTRDGGVLAVPLTLGLRGGLLEGRRLHADPDPADPHGQAWVLEDP